jgi:hypothetical protein
LNRHYHRNAHRERRAHAATLDNGRCGRGFSGAHRWVGTPRGQACQTDSHNLWGEFEIDAGKLAEEARFDGIFVLRTNADVTPLQAVLRYRELLQVEQLFRQSKAVFDTRPIFHSSDAAIRGHVFCTFLALLLQKHLNDLARNAGSNVEWRTLLRELDYLSEARVRSSEKDWLIRSDATPAVAAIFRQARIALPPRARQTSPPKPPPPPQAHRRRGRPRRSATPS